jgi:hypothetical protein
MGWFGGEVLQTQNRVPGEYESLTVGAEAVTLSPDKIKPLSGSYAGLAARAALLSLEAGDIRFRLDGGAPSGVSGHYLASGDTLVLAETQTLEKFQAIRVGEVSATLQVTYFY